MAKLTIGLQSRAEGDPYGRWEMTTYQLPVAALLFAVTDHDYHYETDSISVDPAKNPLVKPIGFRVSIGVELPEPLRIAYEFDPETGFAIFKEYITPFSSCYGHCQREDGAVAAVLRIGNANLFIEEGDLDVPFEVHPDFVHKDRRTYYRDDFCPTVSGFSLNLECLLGYKDVVGETARSFGAKAPRLYRTCADARELPRFSKYDDAHLNRADPFGFVGRDNARKDVPSAKAVLAGRRRLILEEETEPDVMEFPASDIVSRFPLDINNASGWVMLGLKNDLETVCLPDDDPAHNESSRIVASDRNPYNFCQHRLLIYRATDAWLMLFLLDATFDRGAYPVNQKWTQVKISLPMELRHKEVLKKTRKACFPALGRRGMALIEKETGLATAIRMATDSLIGMVRSGRLTLSPTTSDLRYMDAVKKSKARVLTANQSSRYDSKLSTEFFLRNLWTRSNDHPDPNAWDQVDAKSEIATGCKARSRALML